MMIYVPLSDKLYSYLVYCVTFLSPHGERRIHSAAVISIDGVVGSGSLQLFHSPVSINMTKYEKLVQLSGYI
jgi:hypothetical protein